MRPDMDKVIVERPRRKGRVTHKGRKQSVTQTADHDALPLQESMVRAHVERKSLNENLSPLYRWLNAQVGRSWKKVFSELKANMDPRSAVKQHIWQHAREYVYVDNVYYDEHKKPCAVTRPGKFAYITPGEGYQLKPGFLYVCPKTGILKKNGQEKRTRYPRKPVIDPALFVRVSDTLAYARREGVWYALTLDKLPKARLKYQVPGGVPHYGHGGSKHDIWLGNVLGLTCHAHTATSVPTDHAWRANDRALKAYGDGFVYCVTKKQMSSAAIKKAGLKD